MAIRYQLVRMISRNSQRARKLLDDISEDESMERSSYGFNHIRWQVGHMLWGDSYALGLLGGECAPYTEFSERYGSGSVCTGDASDYPTFARLRGQLYTVYDQLLAAVNAATDADLEQITGESEKEMIWEAITFMMMHDAYHSGQVVLMRRVLGRDRPFG